VPVMVAASADQAAKTSPITPSGAKERMAFPRIFRPFADGIFIGEAEQ
jgi:hypothetical protein